MVGLLQFDPIKRISIKDIKCSPWVIKFSKTTYSDGRSYIPSIYEKNTREPEPADSSKWKE